MVSIQQLHRLLPLSCIFDLKVKSHGKEENSEITELPNKKGLFVLCHVCFHAPSYTVVTPL